MKSSAALRVLAELSSSQWGMVTTAQAAALGVGRLDLSRLTEAGHLERLAHGVYRDAGAPAEEFESLRAAWLGADPSASADERLRDLAGGVVVMGESAASLHRVGDLPADRHEFSAPARRQSQRSEIRYRRRELEARDVTIAHGLPVTTVERTIADLVEARTDLSLVAHVLRDAARTRRLDDDRLVELLGPLATRNGLGKGDGAALLGRLKELAGLDARSLAEQIASSNTLGALVAANRLAGLTESDVTAAVGPATQQALRAFHESIARSVEESMAPALTALAAVAGSVTDSTFFADSTALAEFQTKLAEQIAQTLPTQDLLRSFGQEWAATLAGAGARTRTDLQPAIDAVQAANTVGPERSDA